MSATILDPMAGCRAYLEAHERHSARNEKATLPVVTISREAGAGAVTVGELTAQLLNRTAGKTEAPPWTVFDKNLVERVLEDEHLPKSIKKYLGEEVPPALVSAVEETLGLHPSAWNLAKLTSSTIYRLTNIGNAILIGRGASFITAKLKQAIHVRLVAPLEIRVAHLAEYYHLTHDEALAYAKKADQGRGRYVKRYFNADIADPHHYTLVINTGRMDYQSAAHVIVETVRMKAEALGD